MARFLMISIGISVALSTGLLCQVRQRAKMEKIAARTTAQAQSGDSVRLFVIPAQVSLANKRSDGGWFLVVTNPASKTYWWRFQTGSAQTAGEAGPTEFWRSCEVATSTSGLFVFCATNRRIMIAASKRAYSNEDEISGLVQAEFDRRAGALDTGFDYFDKVHNLWPLLGPDFFHLEGHAESALIIRFESIKRLESGGFELLISAIPQKVAQLVLSDDLAIVSHRVVNR
jgi:hypothetical protein